MTALPVACAVLSVAVLIVWMLAPVEPALSLRISKRLAEVDAGLETVREPPTPIAEVYTLTSLTGKPADIPGSWPRFRGPNFDGVSTDPTPLARQWSAAGPPRLWTIDVGEGYAAAAIHNGRVYVHDYDRAGQADMIRCLSLADGADIWRFSYPVQVKRWHGMSRTIPAVTDTHMVALGPKCHVVCLHPDTGALQWAIDLVEEHGATVPQWYAGQCPLIDGDRAILAPGGPDALLMAVELDSGRIAWKTPNPRQWRMTHSSVIPMTIAGRRMFVYAASGGVVAVDPEDGAVLWETTEWAISIATAPSPVPIGDGRIFFTGGYNAGSLMLEVTCTEGVFTATPLFRVAPRDFACIQQTPILYSGHLFGIRYDGQLACLRLDGTLAWTSSSEHRFGLGPFTLAAGMLYVGCNDGTLTLVEAVADDYRPLARADILDGHEAWGPIAIAAGKLIMRDLTRMVCLDIARR